MDSRMYRAVLNHTKKVDPGEEDAPDKHESKPNKQNIEVISSRSWKHAKTATPANPAV